MEPHSLVPSPAYGADRPARAHPVVVVLHGGQTAEGEERSLRCARTVEAAVTSMDGQVRLVQADSFVIPSLADTLDGEARAIVTLADVPRDAGTLQGLLNHLEIPYAGSGLAGCASAARPVTARRLLQAVDVPVAPFGLVRPQSSPHSEAHRILQESSSWSVRIQPTQPVPGPAGPGDTPWWGSAIASEVDALTDLLSVAAPHGPLMYESDIAGQTLWVAVIDDAAGQPRALSVAEGTPSGGRDLLASARALALRAHQALHLRGYALHRFTRYQDTRLLWREVETHPDVSPTGRLFQIARTHHGWSHPAFITALLNTCDLDLPARSQ